MSPRRGLRILSMLGVSLTGHVVTAAILLATPGPTPTMERSIPVQITWLGSLPEPVRLPDREPDPPPEQESLPPVEPVVEPTELPPTTAVSESVVMPDEIAMPAPSEAAEVVGVMVDVDSLRSLESNYWLQVRSEMIQHLRWPAGSPRSALVVVELTIDDEGGLVGVSTHPEPGDEGYARGVERAVRRAAPFPPPGPVCRTARLPVRFSNHNPTEK